MFLSWKNHSTATEKNWCPRLKRVIWSEVYTSRTQKCQKLLDAEPLYNTQFTRLLQSITRNLSGPMTCVRWHRRRWKRNTRVEQTNRVHVFQRTEKAYYFCAVGVKETTIKICRCKSCRQCIVSIHHITLYRIVVVVVPIHTHHENDQLARRRYICHRRSQTSRTRARNIINYNIMNPLDCECVYCYWA